MRLTHFILAVAVTCLWGFNFSIIKFGVEQSNPFLLTALRFYLVAFPLVFFISKPHTSWFYISLYGILFGVGVWGMMSLSIERGLSAGMASTIIQASVIITALLGVIYFKERLHFTQIIGLLISTIGLGMLLYIEDGSVTLDGFSLAIIAAISLSIVNFFIKKAQIKQMFAFIVYSSLFAPIPLLIIALVTDEQLTILNILSSINKTTFLSALIQAYPTTLLGYWIWNRLLTHYPLTLMSPIRLLVPVFGLIGSVLFFQEKIDTFKFISITLVVLGIALPLAIRALFTLKNHIAICNQPPRGKNE